MLDLESAIIHAEKVYEEKLDERSYALEFHDNEEAEKCQKCADEHRQLAEWLKELAERRKLPEIIRCGECAHSNKEYSGEMWCGICNGFGIDENSFCSFAEKRYVENG